MLHFTSGFQKGFKWGPSRGNSAPALQPFFCSAPELHLFFFQRSSAPIHTSAPRSNDFCLALQRSKQFKIKAPALQPIFLSFPALQLVFLSSSTLALQSFLLLRSSAPVTFSVALQRSRTPLDSPLYRADGRLVDETL